MADEPAERKLLIVTSRQYRDGYFEKIGDLVYHREYKGVKNNFDGTFTVEVPVVPEREDCLGC